MSKLLVSVLLASNAALLVSQPADLQVVLQKNPIIQSATARSITLADFNTALQLSITPLHPSKIDVKSCWLTVGVPGVYLCSNLGNGERIGGVSDLLKPNSGDTSRPFYGIVFYHPGEVADPDNPHPWSGLSFQFTFSFKARSSDGFELKVGQRALHAALTKIGEVRWLVLKDEKDRLLAVTKVDDVPMIFDENRRYHTRFLGPKIEPRLVNAIYRIVDAHLIYIDEARNCFE